MSGLWWKTFFDDAYVRIWGEFLSVEQTLSDVEGLWQLLELREGVRVLDAPCGYGRISKPLAERGALVLGVDQSAELLAQAGDNRSGLSADRLRYLHHDLRRPLAETGFDVALNVFSSLGYGTEEDDMAILKTLSQALRPGGLLFVDTNHRDAAVSFFACAPQGAKPARRLKDGTLLVEEPAFDPIRGQIDTCWYWSGPRGGGQKSASVRVYCVTELVHLLEAAGLKLVSAHQGCSPEPFPADARGLTKRVGLLARRPEK